MLPIVLNPNAVAVGLVGAGDGLARRRALLEAAGIEPVALAADVPDEDLRSLSVLFVAGLPHREAWVLAARAREDGVLVNVEDVPALCDFHVPAAVRRGDLLLTVSTGGKAPGLAGLFRQWLDRQIGREWGDRLAEVEVKRQSWRGAGHSPSEVSRRTRALVAERGWLE